MSDYTPNPGSFNLFKNNKKEKDAQPDYTGNGALLDGTPARIAAWLKEGRNGRYFSIKISVEDRERGGPQDAPAQRGQQNFNTADLDDDLPF